MILRILTLFFIGALALRPTRAQTRAGSLSERADYREAVQALRDHLPHVAATRMEKILATIPAKTSGRVGASLLLLESLVRAGSHVEAITLATSQDLKNQPEAEYWLGAALTGAGRFTEAEKVLSSLSTDGFRYASEVIMTRASVLAALSDIKKATEILLPLCSVKDADVATKASLLRAQTFLHAENTKDASATIAALSSRADRFVPSLTYLKALIALAEGQAGAAAAFSSLVSGTRGISRELRHAAMLGEARALKQQGKSGEALAALEKLIGQLPTPSLSILQAAFADFEKLNTPPGPEAESFLQSWATGENEELRILALMASARAMETSGRTKDAAAAFETIATSHPKSVLLPQILLYQAHGMLLAKDQSKIATVVEKLRPIANTPALRAWAAWLDGAAKFEAGNFSSAAKEFIAAAKQAPNLEAKATASYDAALAELKDGNIDPVNSLTLLDSIGTPLARAAGAEFHLERSLYLAAQGDAAARDGLAAFVAAMADHPRRFDALIALAEIEISSGNAAESSAAVAAVTAEAVTFQQKETAAWLPVYEAELKGPPDAFATAAMAFLTAWPDTVRRAPLRMRLGEMYFRRQNFAGAQQQLELLVRDDPSHPLAESALFWAGRAALLSLGANSESTAIALWEKVYSGKGTLRLEARLQVALLNQRRKDHASALQLLAAILDDPSPPSPGVRWQVLCARGEVLIAQNDSPDAVKRGLASFDEVATDASLKIPWQHEALVRKGVCLEQLKRPDEALVAYHSVLITPPDAAAGGDQEDYWFHRAGEKALRILEARGSYEEAIAMAKKMTLSPGPRGRAAAELVNQLALKYGIWLDDPAQ